MFGSGITCNNVVISKLSDQAEQLQIEITLFSKFN